MTTLETLVTDLEISKELKALGVKQVSVFYWRLMDMGFSFGPVWSIQENYGEYSAFTSEELKRIAEGKIISEFRHTDKKFISYPNSNEFLTVATFADKKESNAAAKMLIHLIKNGVVKV